MKRFLDVLAGATSSAPPAPAFLIQRWRTIYITAIVMSLIYAAAAIAFKVYEYADGSWFSFALVVGRPFELIWSNYAGRLAAYGLYVVPAETLLRLGAPPRLALNLEAALYYLTPVASLVASHALLGAEQRWRVVWPSLFFLTVGVLTWGFPTEVWLTGAAAWPLLFVFQAQAANAWRLAAAIGLLIIFVFSHETWLILAPVVLIAHARMLRAPAPAWISWAWGLALVLTIAAWIMAKHILKPDPLVSGALAANARDVFNPAIWLHNVTALKEIALAVIAVGANALIRRAPTWTRAILAGATLLMLAVIAAPHRFNGVSRYTIRGAVMVVEAAFLAAAVFLVAPQARANVALRLPGAASMSLPLLLAALIVLNGVESATFTAAYVRYRALVAAQTAQPGPPATLANPAILASPARWEWALPFQSFLTAPKLDGVHILYSRFGRAQSEPLSCGEAKALSLGESRFGADYYRGIVKFACLTRN